MPGRATILIVGRSGQLARALLREARLFPEISAQAAGRPNVDLLRPETISDIFDSLKPEVVVNTAALTNVDEAERNPKAAFAINRDGAGRLAEACARRAIPLIHISTDFVFNGEKGAPYDENDAPAPVNVYGASKLEGERAVVCAGERMLVLRTAWLYGPGKDNFIGKMRARALGREQPRAVTDILGSPTYAPHLANAILRLCAQVRKWPAKSPLWGIYHLAGDGGASWWELAREALSEITTVDKAKARDFPLDAHRPRDTRLDCSRIKARLNCRLPPWREGAKRCATEISPPSRQAKSRSDPPDGNI